MNTENYYQVWHNNLLKQCPTLLVTGTYDSFLATVHEYGVDIPDDDVLAKMLEFERLAKKVKLFFSGNHEIII